MNAKLPNKTDNQSVESKKSYFESRMTELGITPEDYRMSVFEDDDSTTPKIKEIFSKDSKDNIRILYPNLDGGLYTYSADKKDNPEETFFRTRLKIPQKDGGKYSQPKGTGTFPYFPPKTVEKFTKKEKIPILYIVEGEFKAFKGSLHGLDIIGIGGKDSFKFTKEDGSKELHYDIVRFMEQCKVKTVVLLLDADTRTVKWEHDKEITERPYSFYNTVKNFTHACEVLINQDSPLKRIHFSHIKTEFLKKGKGLDDLLILEGKKANQVIYDLQKLEKSNKFFDGINVGESSEKKIKKFFGLDSFQTFHGIYNEFFGAKDVVYHGGRFIIHEGQYVQAQREKTGKYKPMLSEKMLIERDKLEVEERKKLMEQWVNDSINYGVVSTKGGYMLATLDSVNLNISFTQISNFTLEIKYHIKTGKSNKRVVELINDMNKKVSIDVETKQMSALASFKDFTEGQGNFRFYATSKELDKLKAKWYAEEKSCVQLETLGYHKDNFFAFSNGIFNHTFHAVDSDGVVTLNDKNYFIPYHNPQDENQFVDERRFHFKHSDVTFTEWADLYAKVFGKEGSVVMLFGIACIFSDIIFQCMGNFPMMFLYGEGGTGKSQMVVFFQMLFGIPQTALKLSEKANTDKGKMRVMAQYVNSVVFMEEFINSLDDATIKSLSGIYERLGYKRANITTSYGTDSIPVNSGVIMSGNEYPTNDPLVQRLIVLDFFKNEFSDQEREDFQKLKSLNNKGLTVILGEILQHRESVSCNFRETFANEARSFNKLVREKNITPTERMIQSYSMILTVRQIISPLMPIPVTHEELQEFLIEKIRVHNDRRNIQGEIQTFWDIFSVMARKPLIYHEIDYEVENGEIKIFYQYIHQQYIQTHLNMYKKSGLSATTLKEKLVKWHGFVEYRKSGRIGKKNSSMLVFNYEACNIDLDHAIRTIKPPNQQF
jgi:hypothetical protein